MSVAESHDDRALDGPTLLYLVGRVERVARRAMNDVLAAHGVSLNQYTTLSVLESRSGLSNAQLARRSLVSPQSMNEVLLSLEERGLVRRRAHPEHGRILQAQVTSKGRRLLAACGAEVEALETRMTSGLSSQEQRSLRRALVECVHSLDGGL
ncbi:MAG TPA: MarR family transcriptional regulator, partial [Acidimicrobiales bacterium]|nr:MarR family transcriptional regulator [Acidimicrobiales bacterium]